MAKWCNSFVIVTEPNGTACLSLDPRKLIKVPIRWVHRGPTIHDILPKLTKACYMTIIDGSSGYYSLKLGDNCHTNHIWLSILHVEIHQTTVWSSTSGWHVPVQDWWNLQRPTKCIWHLNCRLWFWQQRPGQNWSR